MLRHLARPLLLMPLMRYVDDYYSVERLGTEDHAMRCFARIVPAILGGSALNKKKMACRVRLAILGLNIGYDEKDIWVRVNEERRSGSTS